MLDQERVTHRGESVDENPQAQKHNLGQFELIIVSCVHVKPRGSTLDKDPNLSVRNQLQFLLLRDF